MKFGSTTIGGISFGSTKIGGAKYGNTLVYQAGSGPQPVMIPYIRGGVGSYIDTGITADDSTRVIVWARNFNPNSVVLFGSRVGGTNQAFGVFATSAQYSGSLRFDYGSTQNIVADAFSKMSGYHKYELDGNKFYVDDTLVGTATAATFENSLNIYLFAINTNGSADNSSMPIDICACKIYKGENLVRDYTPVSSPSVGLYDAVSETVFTNAGSGAFSYGTFDSSAYTPLEYIECSGGQYFTTTESGKYSTSIVTKFRSTPPSAVWGHIIGGNNATQKCDVFTGNASIKNSRLYANLGTGSAGQIKSTSTSGYFDNRDIIVVKANNVFTGYENNASIGSVTGTTSKSFDTGIPMSVGALNNNGTITEYFYGLIYYVGVGGCNYVPAEVNNVAGMYDTYNDVFKPSESGTPFVAGPEINS